MSIDLSNAVWRKSSHSNGDNGACVQVADGFPGVMPVRDSKESNRPALIFSTVAWTAFIDSIRAGDLH